ncbi:MAG: alternative cytochrome c oxidase polypeptide CoxN [Candidatus Pelagibacter sp. TMED106]|jgi:cytochrome c oxidase subunit 3|nr:MAG: alternative cytochrome c oxidase polypeptide CoxN [Candidatus Pelagibacter sp. TMED106]|tara:strand:+ start:6809 stop:7489 length:681 start_codon:yes stop_codon:yes gene_type:complete
MSKFFKNIFGALSEKPWEKEQMINDNYHQGKAFNLSNQTSAVIVIFGVSTVLFSLIVTGYLYSIPAEQDTQYLLKPNLLWINTLILLSVTFFFHKVTKDLKKEVCERVKINLLIIGFLSYAFLFGQIFFWLQLMESGNYVSTNNYFSSFYIFTTLHGLHLLGGLFFWGKVYSKINKLEQKEIINEKRSIEALSLYWTFLLIVWFIFFLIMYVFNDAVIEFCRSLLG